MATSLAFGRFIRRTFRHPEPRRKEKEYCVSLVPQKGTQSSHAWYLRICIHAFLPRIRDPPSFLPSVVFHLSHRVSSCTFFIQESQWRSPFDIFCMGALALAQAHPPATSPQELSHCLFFSHSLSLFRSLSLSRSLEKCLHHALDGDTFTPRRSLRAYRWNALHFHECIRECSPLRRGRTRGSRGRKADERPKGWRGVLL